MKTTTLIYSAVFFLVIMGLFAWGNAARGKSAAQGIFGSDAPKSVLLAPEVFYDFGTISMRNGLVSKDFTITNPTDQDITLKTLITSCMCTKAFIVKEDGSLKGPFGMPGMSYVPPANELIKAGASLTVRALYDPNAHGPAGVGRIDRFIGLADANGGTLEFEIKANVTP